MFDHNQIQENASNMIYYNHVNTLNNPQNVVQCAPHQNALEMNESNFAVILNYFFELYLMDTIVKKKTSEINDSYFSHLYGKWNTNKSEFLNYFKDNIIFSPINNLYVLNVEFIVFMFLKSFILKNVNNPIIQNNIILKELYEKLRVKIQILDYAPRITESKKMLIKYFKYEVNFLLKEYAIFHKMLTSNNYLTYIFKSNNYDLNKNIFENKNNLYQTLKLSEENIDKCSLQLVCIINKDTNNNYICQFPQVIKNLPYENSRIRVNYFKPRNDSFMCDFFLTIENTENNTILETFIANEVYEENSLYTFCIIIPYYLSFSYSYMRSKLMNTQMMH